MEFSLTTATRAVTCPIHLVPASARAEWLDRASVRARSWASATAFDASEERLLLVPGDTGNAAEAYLFGDELNSGWAGPLDFVRASSKLPPGNYRVADPALRANADFALGWLLGGYHFTKYKGTGRGQKKAVLETSADLDIERISTLASSVFFGRDLVCTPAHDLGPNELANAACDLASEYGAECKVTVGSDLLKEGLALIHAVGRASDRAPRLIDLTWGEVSHPTVTLVGKGVCFDTGGIAAKTFAGMRHMSCDMAGGALALALGRQIMATRLPVRLRILVPAVDNSISGNAYRPGDVITARNGHRVEIIHPDAEGRLVLADALSLAAEETPSLVISLATLTGAVAEALGEEIAGYMTSDDALAGMVEQAATSVGDPIWRLPLYEAYRSLLRSEIADIRHLTEGYGSAGSITAALFLQNFAQGAKSFMHVDFAGRNSRKDAGPLVGGNVLGLRALFETLKIWTGT